MALVTLEVVRRALDLDVGGSYTATHTRDALINELIPQVQAFCEKYCQRSFDADTGITEKHAGRGGKSTIVYVERPPITTLTSVHVSTDAPRVYDSTTVLTADEDYIADLTLGKIVRIDGSYFPEDFQSVQVVYDGGYSTIPKDLERAAIEIIANKLFKGTGKLYHLTSESGVEGSVAGVRFDDVPDNARAVLDFYRRATL